MITIEQAKSKIRQIDAKTSKDTHQILCDVLDRNLILKQQETFKDERSPDYIGWIENRLAQPHLGYLPADQANGIWGGSTTEALAKLAANYHIAYDIKSPILGSDLLRALLDGTKPNEAPVKADKHSYDWFKALYVKHGYTFTETPGHFNVLGVRGYLLPKGEVANIGDQWNDTIFLIWLDQAGAKRVHATVASCDPGLYYYHIAPMNPSGCAHLVEGQYKYQRGLHGQSQYPAFVQAGPTKVARTNQANYNDRTKRDTGYFGVNIHAGYSEESVYNSSAGCQVIAGLGRHSWQWTRFHSLLNSYKGRFFYYTLMNASDLRG